MDGHHILVICINGTVRQLRKLQGKRRSIGGCDFAAWKFQHQGFLQFIIPFLFLTAQPDFLRYAHQLRHFQVIGRLHGHGDVGNLVIDGFFRSRQGFVGIHHHAIALIRLEVQVPVLADISPQPLSHIQDAELGPEIHQTIAAGCTCKPDDAFHPGTQGLHGPEPLRLVVLEARQLVQDNHIEIQVAVLIEPYQVLPVHDIDIRILLQGSSPFCHAADHDGTGKTFQVVPLLDFIRPGVSRHPQRSDNQHPLYFKGVIHQVPDGRQRRHRLAKSHVQEQGRDGMGLDIFDGVFLIFMRHELHALPPPFLSGVWAMAFRTAGMSSMESRTKTW